jgi:hypothetical protein
MPKSSKGYGIQKSKKLVHDRQAILLKSQIGSHLR